MRGPDTAASFPILGTAQLGMSYGIANRIGQPDRPSAFRILETAVREGISTFDTAAAYGTSESILGEFIESQGLHTTINIVSKIAIGETLDDYRKAIGESLRRLRIRRLDLLLLHQCPEPRSLAQAEQLLEKMVEEGFARAIGVSVYTPQEALTVLQCPGLHAAQVPSSIADQRFSSGGVLHYARDNGRRVDVRSIFLQGLLAMDVADVPVSLRRVIPFIERLDAAARAIGRSRLETCVAFVRDLSGVSGVIFGAETDQQVREFSQMWHSAPLEPEFARQFTVDDLPVQVVDPRRWPR